jgi:hypothetical protein
LKSILEKEVDNQIKKKELEDIEKEVVAKDKELQRKELELQHLRDEVDIVQGGGSKWYANSQFNYTEFGYMNI